MARDDPAALVALGVVMGMALVLLGSLVAGLRSDVAGAGGAGAAAVGGFRVRLLAVFDAARLEVAVAGVVAVAILGLSTGPGRAQVRRPLLVGLGALSAYVAFAAVVRTVVLITLLGKDGGLLGATIQAAGAIPAALGATTWAALLITGPAPEGEPPTGGHASS